MLDTSTHQLLTLPLSPKVLSSPLEFLLCMIEVRVCVELSLDW